MPPATYPVARSAAVTSAIFAFLPPAAAASALRSSCPATGTTPIVRCPSTSATSVLNTRSAGSPSSSLASCPNDADLGSWSYSCTWCATFCFTSSAIAGVPLPAMPRNLQNRGHEVPAPAVRGRDHGHGGHQCRVCRVVRGAAAEERAGHDPGPVPAGHRGHGVGARRRGADDRRPVRGDEGTDGWPDGDRGAVGGGGAPHRRDPPVGGGRDDRGPPDPGLRGLSIRVVPVRRCGERTPPRKERHPW